MLICKYADKLGSWEDRKSGRCKENRAGSPRHRYAGRPSLLRKEGEEK